MSHSQIDVLLERVRKVTADTAENLQRELRQIEQEKQRITAALDHAAESINQTLRHLGMNTNRQASSVGSAIPAAAAPATHKKGRKGKRIRRGPGELKQYADGIYQLVKSKGAAGARGGEIRSEYPKVGQDIKGFVQKHGDHKLRTTGEKSLMRYHTA